MIEAVLRIYIKAIRRNMRRDVSINLSEILRSFIKLERIVGVELIVAFLESDHDFCLIKSPISALCLTGQK
jgi:hypothetical protein